MLVNNAKWWSNVRMPAGLLVLALFLSLLAGCSTAGKAKPEPVNAGASATETAVVASGPSVARLGEGREGFVVSEIPLMDAKSLADFDRAVALMGEGDYEKSVDLLEKVIEGSPGVTAPYIDIAIAYERLGKPEQAEQNLKTALGLVSDHPVAGNEYGLLLRKAGRFAEARTIYEKTLASFPEYLPARRNLGILCDMYLNDLSCALEQYEIYSEAKPGDEQVKVWIADLRMRMGGQ